MPVILADIIEHLTAAETDLAVVGRFGDGEQSLPAALDAEADVLVLQRGALAMARTVRWPACSRRGPSRCWS